MRWSEAEYARYIQNTKQYINTILKKRGLTVYVLIVKRRQIITVN